MGHGDPRNSKAILARSSNDSDECCPSPSATPAASYLAKSFPSPFPVRSNCGKYGTTYISRFNLEDANDIDAELNPDLEPDTSDDDREREAERRRPLQKEFCERQGVSI